MQVNSFFQSKNSESYTAQSFGAQKIIFKWAINFFISRAFYNKLTVYEPLSFTYRKHI